MSDKNWQLKEGNPFAPAEPDDMDFKLRSATAIKCLPMSGYRDMLALLHINMIQRIESLEAQLAAQAGQEPIVIVQAALKAASDVCRRRATVSNNEGHYYLMAAFDAIRALDPQTILDRMTK